MIVSCNYINMVLLTGYENIYVNCITRYVYTKVHTKYAVGCVLVGSAVRSGTFCVKSEVVLSTRFLLVRDL